MLACVAAFLYMAVFIADKQNDIPAWMYLNISQVRSIRIDPPSAADRLAFMGGYRPAAFFDRVVYAQDAAAYAGRENEWRKIVDRFVAYGYTRDNAHKMIYIVIEMLSSVCADAILYDKPFTLPSLRRMITESAVSLIESGAAIPCEAAGEPDAAGTETEIRQEDIA